MATYYLWSGASGGATGADWTNAFTGLQSALTAASSGSDVIKVQKTHVEGGSQFTATAKVAVICVDKDSSDALAEMDGTTGYIGSTVNSIYTGGYAVYMRGFALTTATGASSYSITVALADGSDFTLENCKLWAIGNHAGARVFVGADTASNCSARFINCDFKFNNASAGIALRAARCIIEGGQINSAGTAVSPLLVATLRGATFLATGFDVSHITGTLVGNQTSVQGRFVFNNCKLGSGVVPLATQTPSNTSSGEVWLFNCAAGDQHYHIAHYNALGSTVCDTGIYANDGALYDGTNHVSWKINSTEYATIYSPYISPWIDRYHDGTSAITPYLEIVRSGSATAFQDDEVWPELSYQGTSGFPLAVMASGRMAVLGAPENVAAGTLDASGWTGENATSWFGKLSAGSVTPAEIGHLRARVCVGEPSVTVYVDPTIRL